VTLHSKTLFQLLLLLPDMHGWLQRSLADRLHFFTEEGLICVHVLYAVWVIYGWRCCSWQLHDIVSYFFFLLVPVRIVITPDDRQFYVLLIYVAYGTLLPATTWSKRKHPDRCHSL